MRRPSIRRRAARSKQSCPELADFSWRGVAVRGASLCPRQTLTRGALHIGRRRSDHPGDPLVVGFRRGRGRRGRLSGFSHRLIHFRLGFGFRLRFRRQAWRFGHFFRFRCGRFRDHRLLFDLWL